MKKLLALVLALVMTLSLCTISNAAFTDAKDVDASYEEAVAVLNGMGVFKGYEDGSFKPEGSITRAEVAAIVYRLYTGDVKDKQAGLYAGYGKFDDMAGAAWAAGYVGFCANAGFVKGYGDGKFGPSDPVTGYQALAMILRAVGYGKNGEFEGADWELHVAQIAQQLKVLKNVKGVSLKAAASRELVAELLFQVAAYVDTVEYTPAFGYVSNTVVTAKAETLGEKNFNLTKSADGEDAWGRPQYKWFSDDNGNKKVDTKETKYATIQAKPEATYTTAVTECQVASDVGIKTSKTYDTYTNGADNASKYIVQATDTVGKIGAQGRLTEVYEDRIVMIDTLLATVENVSAVKYDAAGHIKTYAKLELKVYDDTTPTTVIEESSTNWEYTKGQVLLVSAVQDGDSQVVKAAGKNYAKYIEIQGVADSVVGTQTTIWVLANQHTINGTTYYDNNRLALNQAGVDSTKNFNWYFDAYGNVIGSTVIPATYTYGILKSMIWNVGTPGYASAVLIDPATGAESTVTVNTIDGSAASPFTGWENKTYTPTYSVSAGTAIGFNSAKAYVGNDSSQNAYYNGFGLYRVETLANGTVNLDGYEVVGYKHAGTIATNATYFEGAGGAGDRVYVDDYTVFTVRTATPTGYVYQQYVGKANVPSFDTATARTFYVKGTDGYADYVYIKEGTLTYAGNAFVMATAPTYKTMFDGSTYFDVLVNAIVGTEPKVDAVKDTSADGNIRTLSARVGVPHYVTYNADGSISTMTRFETSAQSAAGTTDYVKLYKPGYSGTTLLWNKDATNQASYNTTLATVVGDYTSLDAVTDWNDVNVYVVYDENTMYASIIYVVNKAEGETDSSVPADPTAASLTMTRSGDTFTAKLAQGSETITSATVYVKVRLNGGAWSTPVAMTYVSGSYDATNHTWQFSSTVALTGSGTYDVCAYAVDGGETIATTTYVVVR